MALFQAAASVLVALSVQASGATPSVVIGGNAAQSCYQAAQREGAFHGDIQDCLAALEDLRLSIDDRAATYVNLGILLRRRGNVRAAINAYDRALALRPELAEAWLNRGVAHISLGEAHRAIEDFDRALALEPDRPELALVNRAAAHEALGDLDAAYADLQAVLALTPDFEPARVMIARYEVRAGDPDGGR